MQLEVRELSYSYSDTPVFHHLSFTLSRGQVLHCKGVNGSGKSTLLKCLAKLKIPEQGGIYLDGNSIEQMPDYVHRIAYLGHLNALNPLLTLEEQLYLSPYLLNPTPKQIRDLMSLLELSPLLLKKPIAQFSQGQKRKSAFLHILLKDASIWILDEPFAGVDDQGCVQIQQCITQHAQSGGMVILTNHQFDNADCLELCLTQEAIH